MEYTHSHVVAKRVAAILAENEATVNDLSEIFRLVKDYLIVTVNNRQEQKWGYLFGNYMPPDHSADDDGKGNE